MTNRPCPSCLSAIERGLFFPLCFPEGPDIGRRALLYLPPRRYDGSPRKAPRTPPEGARGEKKGAETARTSAREEHVAVPPGLARGRWRSGSDRGPNHLDVLLVSAARSRDKELDIFGLNNWYDHEILNE